MQQIKLLLAAVATVAGVALLTGCDGRDGVFDQVHSPVTFFVDPVLEDGEWSSAEVVLDSDGSAAVRDYPVGAVDTESSGRICLEPSGEPLSAQGSWRADDKGHIFLSFDDSESILGAGVQNMGELDWARPGIAFCGQSDVLLFVTRDARE